MISSRMSTYCDKGLAFVKQIQRALESDDVLKSHQLIDHYNAHRESCSICRQHGPLSSIDDDPDLGKDASN